MIEAKMEPSANMAKLARCIAQADASDLDTLRQLLDARGILVAACTTPGEAAELYRLGEALEQKIRIARAKLTAQSAECYQTGFLLRALAADLGRRPEPGASLDLKA